MTVETGRDVPSPRIRLAPVVELQLLVTLGATARVARHDLVGMVTDKAVLVGVDPNRRVGPLLTFVTSLAVATLRKKVRRSPTDTKVWNREQLVRSKLVAGGTCLGASRGTVMGGKSFVTGRAHGKARKREVAAGKVVTISTLASRLQMNPMPGAPAISVP
jgi:hypothetical protein